MDPIEQLKADVLSGRIDANRLVDLIATVQRELQAAKQRIAELEQRNAELEQKPAATSGTAKLDEPFSMRAEEKRQEARGKKRRKRKDKGRRGRVRTADKIAQAERTEDVYPFPFTHTGRVVGKGIEQWDGNSQKISMCQLPAVASAGGDAPGRDGPTAGATRGGSQGLLDLVQAALLRHRQAPQASERRGGGPAFHR